jgi:hypothetical protein
MALVIISMPSINVWLRYVSVFIGCISVGRTSVSGFLSANLPLADENRRRNLGTRPSPCSNLACALMDYDGGIGDAELIEPAIPLY